MTKQKLYVTFGVGCACLVSLVLVVALIVRAKATPTDEETAGLIPPKELKNTRPPALHRSPAAPSSLDMLELVDASKDAIAGRWGFQERALITSDVQWSRLQLPCIPPEEYDLRIKVTRKRGVNSLNVGVVLSGKQGMLVLDGWDGRTNCLLLGDGSEPATGDASVPNLKVLKWNKPTELLVQVRRDAVSLAVDGKKLIDWKGEPAELFLPSGYFVPERRALTLGSWETIFRIDEYVLIPVTGQPTLTRVETAKTP